MKFHDYIALGLWAVLVAVLYFWVMPKLCTP